MKQNTENLGQLSFGVPIQAAIRIKPNLGHYPEDLKLNGDRIGILDVNGRIREEYECANIFPGNESSLDVYNAILIPYLRASLEGVNVSVLALGTSGSGKSYTVQGENNSPGIFNFFVQAMFDGLEEKKKMFSEGRKFDKTFTFRVKIRALEIVCETISDLLKNSSSNMTGEELLVQPDEWEGITVKGATWLPCASAQHLVDLFAVAKQNRASGNSSFGSLHEQSTCIYTLEIFQITTNQASLETTVLSSRVYFVDLPCHEKLLDLNAKIRESSYSQAIFSVSNVIQGLNREDRYTDYDQSIVTQLMKDMIGGNSMAVAVFCLQNGDSVGSSLVLSHMRMMRGIMNYPVVNDSRLIGLLRKYRLDIIELLSQLKASGAGIVDILKKKIQDLEREKGVFDIDKLRFSDEKGALNENVKGLKESYNKLAKDKADLQKQLIDSEKDRLIASKQVIEMKIRIAELEENHADNKYSINTRLIQAEKEIKLAQQKEEKSMVAVHEAQEKMIKAVQEKTEIEMEFLALKKNFFEQGRKLNEEKAQSERLTAEIVNLVNANSTLANDTDYLSKLKSSLSNDQKNLASENMRLRTQVRELQESLLNAKTEIDSLKVEITRYDLSKQRQHADFDNRKLELERGYLQMAHKREEDIYHKVSESESAAKRLKNQEEFMKSEISSLQHKLKSSERKIQELEDHLSECKSLENEIASKNNNLTTQLDELRGHYRGNLMKGMIDPSAAKEDLVRSYNNRESDLLNQVNSLISAKSSLVKTIRGLRSYARTLKNLAEDWAPVGQPLPNILTLPPAMLLEDEDITLDTKAQILELDRLRKKNAQLEQEIRAVQAQNLGRLEGDTQKRLFGEIEMLRAATPSSASEIEGLRKEKNQLKEENKRLLQEIRKNSAGEVERLKKVVAEYEKGAGKGLQQRLNYLEEVLRKVEKERSELSVRATIAEEQLKNMQEHMDNSVQNYQKKIMELSRRVGK